MKRLLIILGLGLTIGLANVNTVESQIVNVYVNIDLQPAWGPAGYNYAAFYYFPALNIYYDINNALFYYLSRNMWVSSHYLPLRYQRYDFYTLYKVVLNDYHNPWVQNRVHRRVYVNYRDIRTQLPIRSVTTDRRYNIARANTRDWVEHRQAQPSNNRSSRSSTVATRNNNYNNQNNASNRSSTSTQTRQNRPQNNNQSMDNQSSRSNSNTPPSSTSQMRQNRNQSSNQSVGNQNTNRSNQNTSTTRSTRSENSNTTVTRSSRPNENNSSSSTTTRSSGNTQRSRSERWPAGR